MLLFVVVHLTGSVLDEDAPFGSSILRSFYSARVGRGSCSESLSRLCACRLRLVCFVVPVMLSSKAVYVLLFHLVA